MSAESTTLEDNPPATAASVRPRIILGTVALALAAYLAHAWWFNRHFEETDNAEVNGFVIPVLPKVGGFVQEVLVHDNQAVKAGDPLVRIDDRDYQSHLEQADADLANLEATVGGHGQVGQAMGQIQTAQAQAAAAHSTVLQAEADSENAQKELARLKPLLAQNIVSPDRYDAAEANARSAAARLQSARENAQAADQQITVFSAALRGADARLRSAKAARDIATRQVTDTVIRAARDGIVSHKSVEVGQLIQPGQPLMDLVPMDDVWIEANLKETQIRDISIGAPTYVEVDSYPGVRWEGQVESFSPATGAKFTLLPPDNATGNFTKVVQRIPVRIRLAAHQHADMVLRPGMSAFVTIAKH